MNRFCRNCNEPVQPGDDLCPRCFDQVVIEFGPENAPLVASAYNPSNGLTMPRRCEWCEEVIHGLPRKFCSPECREHAMSAVKSW